MRKLLMISVLLLCGCAGSIYPTPAPVVLTPVDTTPVVVSPAPVTTVPSPPAPVIQPKCFQLVDSTLYANKPNLYAMGFRAAPTTNPFEWWKESPGMSQEDVIKMHATEVGGQPVMFDYEEASYQTLTNLYTWMREGGDTGQIAYYGALPIRDYWRAVGAFGPAAYKQWQAENDARAPLVSEVAMLFPSLYTFYTNQPQWVTYAKANLSEARRISQGKPVYPFIWPQYHNSNPSVGLQFIDPAFWTLEMQTIYDSGDADGMTLWGGWDFVNDRPAQWDESAPWWQATKAFIKTIPNLCPP
jgi:hypothetical protein